MQKIVRATLVAIGIMPLSLFADSADFSFSESLSESRAIVGANVGKYFGGEADVLVPLAGSNSHLIYTDFQAYQYGDQHRTVGAGVGYRQIWGDAIYGTYGFYDWQRSENKNEYRRINVGFERLTETWDVRANYSFQVGSEKSIVIDQGLTASTVSGNDISNRHDYDREEVYDGGSVEVGRTLGSQALRAYVGGYAYGPDIRGASARVEYQLNDRITLTANGQHDDARGWLGTAGVQYWIGKTGNSAKHFSLSNRLRDKVVRDMTVAASVDYDYHVIENDPRKIYFVSSDATAATNGFEGTPTTISDALAKSSADDIIYLQNGNYTLAEATSINNGRTLWGSGQDLTLPNGVVIKAGTSSTRPTIGGFGLTVDGDATLGGFSVVGDGTANMANGINVTSGAVTIDGVYMTGSFTNGGIQVIGSGASATIKNSNIYNEVTTGTQGHAIFVQNGAVGYISDSTVRSANENGIYLADAGGTSTITNVIANSNEHYGIRIFNSKATISGGTMNSNTLSGIGVVSGSTVTINGATASSNTLYGLFVEGASSATVADSIFNSNTLSGIFANQANTTVTLSGANQIKDNLQDGIFASNSAIVTMTSGTITGNGQQAIDVTNDASVTITSPTSLVGQIQKDNDSDASVTINGVSQLTVITTTKTCSITGDSGTCV